MHRTHLVIGGFLAAGLLLMGCSDGSEGTNIPPPSPANVFDTPLEPEIAPIPDESQQFDPTMDEDHYDSPYYEELYSDGARYTLDQVAQTPYCSLEHGFCANFPAVEEWDGSSFGSMIVEPADSSASFVAYTSDMRWGYVGETAVICGDVMDTSCDPEFEDSMITDDSYSVYVLSDWPGAKIEEFDNDCMGRSNRTVEVTTFAGEEAAHVTCNAHSANPLSFREIYYVRHGGLVYEILSTNYHHRPFFGEAFFASFRFVA